MVVHFVDNGGIVNYMTFQSFDLERIGLWVFQKRVVCALILISTFLLTIINIKTILFTLIDTSGVLHSSWHRLQNNILGVEDA